MLVQDLVTSKLIVCFLPKPLVQLKEELALELNVGDVLARFSEFPKRVL